MQDGGISSANALGIPQSCTKPWKVILYANGLWTQISTFVLLYILIRNCEGTLEPFKKTIANLNQNIKIYFQKMHFKMLSAKWWPFWPGGHFKNTYELLYLRALLISILYKHKIFQCMSKIFCVEFQRFSLKFHTKYLTHTLKDDNLIQCWSFKKLKF